MGNLGLFCYVKGMVQCKSHFPQERLCSWRRRRYWYLAIPLLVHKHILINKGKVAWLDKTMQLIRHQGLSGSCFNR